LLEAASAGDLNALHSQEQAGTDLFVVDYDKRCALHLAAVAGHAAVVEFLISMAPADRKAEVLSQKDRWGATPLNEAQHHGNHKCI
jgi:ankyrin repeat protein